MSRDITMQPVSAVSAVSAATADIDEMAEARQNVLDALFDVRAYDAEPDEPATPVAEAAEESCVACAAIELFDRNELPVPHQGCTGMAQPATTGPIEATSTDGIASRTSADEQRTNLPRMMTALHHCSTLPSIEAEDETDPHHRAPAAAVSTERAPTRLRSAVHHVASASAALALATIIAGIGSAAVDALNALKLDESRSLTASPVQRELAFAARSELDTDPVHRLAFVRSAAFAASIAQSQSVNSDGAQSIAALPKPAMSQVETIKVASRSFATPNVVMRDALVVPVAAAPAPAETITVAAAPISILNGGEAARPAPAKSNMDEIASILGEPDAVVPKPVRARLPAMRELAAAPAQISAAEPAMTEAAMKSARAGEANSAAPTASPWVTTVQATEHGRRIQNEVAANDRAQRMRKNAFGLGVPGGAQSSEPVLKATMPAPVAEPTPWYLRKPSWSPFANPESQSR